MLFMVELLRQIVLEGKDKIGNYEYVSFFLLSEDNNITRKRKMHFD